MALRGRSTSSSESSDPDFQSLLQSIGPRKTCTVALNPMSVLRPTFFRYEEHIGLELWPFSCIFVLPTWLWPTISLPAFSGFTQAVSFDWWITLLLCHLHDHAYIYIHIYICSPVKFFSEFLGAAVPNPLVCGSPDVVRALLQWISFTAVASLSIPDACFNVSPVTWWP